MASSLSVIEALSQLLADTYLLYTKTQNFHWNVTGRDFYALHQFFETQYQALAEAVDVLAERIRALNAPSPGSFDAFKKIATIQEAETSTLNAKEMMMRLLADHTKLSANIDRYFAITSETKDEVTHDILIERKTEHDKFAWMLRSSLD